MMTKNNNWLLLKLGQSAGAFSVPKKESGGQMKRLALGLSLMLLCFNVYATMVNDFDKTNPYPFQFKDEKGSVFNSGTVNAGSERGKVVMFKYNIVDSGYAGWGIPLKNYNASKQMFLTFYVKGEIGGEQFEIALKDKNDYEKKIPTNSYFDITKDWQKINVPLTSFVDVRLESLDSVSFNFNDIQVKGVVYIDDIGFEGEAENAPVPETEEKDIKRSNKVLIDGFERVNPYDFYTVRSGNDSSLSLASSRLLHDGDYSMQMDYLLSSALTTWAAASWESMPDTLNWEGAEDVKIWIKGDGTENVFRISLFDGDGEMWSFDDYNAMKSTKWTLVSAKVSDFVLAWVATKKNGVLDLSAIKGVEIGVWNKTSLASGGRIWVDQFYISGVGLTPALATPPSVVEKLRLAVPSIGNIDLSGNIYTEYMQTPEESQKLSHWAKMIASAKVGDYSGRMEFASQSQNFSDSAYRSSAADKSGRVTVTAQNPKVEMPSIQVMGNNINYYLSNLTIGNIWFEYSKYTFAYPSLGGYGYKGVTAEGDVDRLNYHVFYINQPYDSFVAGTRWISYYTDWKFVFYGVHDYLSAKVDNSGRVTNGTLSGTNSLDIKPVWRDTVTSIEIWHWLMDKKIQIECNAGWDNYEKYASNTVLESDPAHPIYNYQLPATLKYFDPLYRAKVETNDLVLPGSIVSAEYRYIGAEFRPSFRKEPAWFDNSDSNQKGYNIRWMQKYSGLQVSVEYDDLTRLSSSRHYRYSSIFSAGYYGYAGLDAALTYTRTRENYIYTNTERDFYAAPISANYVAGISEIYVRNQVNSKTAVWFKILSTESEDQSSFAKYFTSSLYAKYEYYLSTNAKLFAEYKTTRYPERAWEPTGYPFDDNYTKVTFELTF